MAVVDPAVLYRALTSLPVYQPANIVGLPAPSEKSAYSINPGTIAALALAGGPARNIPGTYDALISGTSTLDSRGKSVPARPTSRIAARDGFSRLGNWASQDRPGPARAAERADAQARAMVEQLIAGEYKGRPVERGTLSGPGGRDDNPKLMAAMEAIANNLLGEEPISARTIDPSVSENERTGAFTSEDPTLQRSGGKVSGDINPFYTVEVPARIPREGGRSGTWTVDTGSGFRPAVARIDPSQVIDSVVQNPRRGPFGYTGESDNTASFQREKPVSIGDLVKEVMNEERTPVITESALRAARTAGRARAIPPSERQGSLVGYMTPPGSEQEVPVYSVSGFDGARQKTPVQRPDPKDPLRKVQTTNEPYFRVGYPLNRDDIAIRSRLASVLGASDDRQYGPAPMLANWKDRVDAEKRFGSPKLEEFLREVSGGSFMQDPDEAASSYKLLANALLTGEIQVAGARPGEIRSVPVDREAILALQSPDGRPLFAPGSNARTLLQQAAAELRGGREVDLFPEPVIDAIGDNAASVQRGEAALLDFLRGASGSSDADLAANAAEAFGYEQIDEFAGDSGDVQGRYGDFGDAQGGVSIQKVPYEAGDVLEKAAIALTGDVNQGLVLADIARRSAAPGQRTGVNAYGTAVGPIETLPARDPMAVLLELTGRRSPVEETPGAQQLRRQYQNDFESISGAGRYVKGQRGYNMMAEGLGAPLGSPAQEKAMALLAGRLTAQRERQAQEAQASADMASATPIPAVTSTANQSIFNAPAPVASDPVELDRQAGRERLQRRRQGYTGGIADRFVGNFGQL
jgi:hypothetical protein